MATSVGRIPRHARAGSARGFVWPLAKRRHDAAALRAELHLAAGERVLIRIGRAHSATVVATERALYWYPSIAGWIRLGWDEIGQLYEDHVTASLVVTCLSAHRVQPAVLSIPTNRRLLDLAQERIAATRIVRTQLPIDGHELLVEGRRLLGTDELRWFIRLGHELDAKDPALPGKVDRAVAELRATLGI
jgi:hypothetical protein